MVKLGSLRAVNVHTYAQIPKADFKTETEICRDGDKYEFALDGIVLNIDKKENTDLLDSEILIDFSIFPTEKAEELLVDFPYSCKGTRGNPDYIPLSKETGFPMLPKNKKWYFKIRNTNATYKIQGVAIVIYGYPVVGD